MIRFRDLREECYVRIGVAEFALFAGFTAFLVPCGGFYYEW
jgi:hypothetical protein